VSHFWGALENIKPQETDAFRAASRYDRAMPAPQQKNFAFIDGQNLYLGARDISLTLDYRRFRIYLRERFQVAEAYYFIGYIHAHQAIYASLQRAGFILQFKEVARDADGKTKGNVDVDLTLRAIDKIGSYDQAVLVTSDGDFASLVSYLVDKNKFRTVISPTRAKCSYLLRRSAKGKIDYLEDVRSKIDLKK
jgi:uncharacterized LabA/DUF88 family protein